MIAARPLHRIPFESWVLDLSSREQVHHDWMNHRRYMSIIGNIRVSTCTAESGWRRTPSQGLGSYKHRSGHEGSSQVKMGGDGEMGRGGEGERGRGVKSGGCRFEFLRSHPRLLV